MSDQSGLKETITVRYAQEAETCCNLSCGGALDLAEVQAGETLLDLGSGRGNDVIKAADIVGDEGRAIGVDFTDRMLLVARNTATKLGLDNVAFLEGEIDRIPLDEASVDVVISNCTVNHAKDKTAVYREINRVLKPGGRFIISDILADKDLPQEVKDDPEAWAACYGGAIVREEYFQAMADGGFSNVEILEQSEPYEKGTVMVISMTLRGYKS